MKSIFTIASLAMLLGALVWGTTSAAAQEEASPREAILASIPTLSNFEEQADTTFVGDVEGSYAYIAFVVRDNFAVVYLCDNILSHWLSGEIVDGTLEVAAEDGTRIVATIFDDHIEGTVTLTTDDDGSEASPHTFTAVPAVPGETGLDRRVGALDEGIQYVSGWIVTEDGIRGRRRLIAQACAVQQQAFELARQQFSEAIFAGDDMLADGWIAMMQDARMVMETLGC